MKTAVIAALAAVCLAASPAWAGSKHKAEMNGPACITAAQAEAVIKAKGGPSTAIRLDGDSAHKLVDAVNRVGEPVVSQFEF